MSNQIELIVISVDDLKKIIRSEINETLSQANLNFPDNRLIKRRDVADLLGVSIVTVHGYMKQGKIPYHTIGGRTFFKKQEVIDSLSKARK